MSKENAKYYIYLEGFLSICCIFRLLNSIPLCCFCCFKLFWYTKASSSHSSLHSHSMSSNLYLLSLDPFLMCCPFPLLYSTRLQKCNMYQNAQSTCALLQILNSAYAWHNCTISNPDEALPQSSGLVPWVISGCFEAPSHPLYLAHKGIDVIVGGTHPSRGWSLSHPAGSPCKGFTVSGCLLHPVYPAVHHTRTSHCHHCWGLSPSPTWVCFQQWIHHTHGTPHWTPTGHPNAIAVGATPH